MSVWQFAVQENIVLIGGRTRAKVTRHGCNEPYRGRYWCPKKQWFRSEACPFSNLRECDNFEFMCGAIQNATR